MTARIEIIRNFLDPASCQALAEWALENEATALGEGHFKVGAWQNRRTSRSIPKDRYTLPPLAYQIRDRIHALFPEPRPRIAHNGGKDGVIIVATYPGGDTVDHLDPQPVPGVDLLRANIVVQSAESEGGLYVGGEQVDIGQGDLHLYAVCQHTHGVRTVGGSRPRIIWLFSFCVNGADWDAGRIQIKPPPAG